MEALILKNSEVLISDQFINTLKLFYFNQETIKIVFFQFDISSKIMWKSLLCLIGDLFFAYEHRYFPFLTPLLLTVSFSLASAYIVWRWKYSHWNYFILPPWKQGIPQYLYYLLVSLQIQRRNNPSSYL